MFPPPDSTGTYQAPQLGGLGGAPINSNNYNVPPPSAPPITAYGVQGPSGTNITTPQSQGSNGFLDVVTSTLGNMAQGVGNLLGLSKYTIAQPLSLMSVRPDLEADAEHQTIGNMVKWLQTGGQEGSINPGDYFKTVDQDWQNVQMPGVLKFGYETLTDPLTYMSSGVLKAGQLALRGLELGGIAGTAADAAATAMNPAIHGMETYENAVNAGVRGITDFSGGILNARPTNPFLMRDYMSKIPAGIGGAVDKTISFIPSDAAKDNARGILNQVLPSGLVENVLNYVPEEYTGVPIGPIADYLNKPSIFGKQLGLPDYISIPDFRIIARQNASEFGYKAIQSALSETGDPTMRNNILKNIYASPNETLTDAQNYVKSMLQEPAKFNADDISALSKAVGGTLNDPNPLAVQAFNDSVGLYARSQVNGQRLLTTEQTLQSLGNQLGADLKNPDTSNIIMDAMRSQDQKSLNMIDDLTKIDNPSQLYDTFGDYSKNIADAEFTSGVQQQRLQNTLWNDFLDAHQSVADSKYAQMAGGAVKGINALSIQTLGMPLMNAAESYLRYILEGGGGKFPGAVDKDAFQAENALIQNVPLDVRRAAYHGFTDQMDDSLLQRVSGSNPVLGWLADKEKFINTWTNNTRNNVYLTYWRQALSQEIESASKAMGFSIRPDANAFIEATKAPDVTQVPELAGVDQRYVNGVTSAGVKVSPNRDAMTAYQNTLDASQINKYALTHDLDQDPIVGTMGVAPRAYLRDAILNGDGTAASIADAIDQTITQHKAILKESPPVKADIFEGAVNSIENNLNSPVFGPRDLNNSMGQIMNMQNQITDMPGLYRQAEHDAINNAIRSPNGWRGAIHSEYNGNIVDFLQRTDPILNRAYTALNTQGAALGVDTSKLTSLMEADRSMLQATWAQDRNFQDGFFATNPDKSNPLTWSDPVNGTGYYDQRDRIWNGFWNTHNTTMANIQQEQLNISNQLLAKQALGQIPPDVNTLADAADTALEQDAVYPPTATQWTENPGQHTATINGHDVTINRNPTSKRWSYDITKSGDTVEPPPLQSPTLDMNWRILQPGQHQSDYEGYTALINRSGNRWSTSVVRPDGTEIPKNETYTLGSAKDARQFANIQISNDIETNNWRARRDAAEPPQIIAQNQGRYSNISKARGAAETHVNSLFPRQLEDGSELFGSDPTAQIIADTIEHGLQTGQTPSEIASGVNSISTPIAGNGDTESIIDPSSETNRTQVLGAADNGTINQSGNAAEVIEPSSDYLSAQYANADNTIRPAIESIIQDHLNNPRMPQQAIDYLKQRLENMYVEHQQLPQETKKIWNDVLDVASQRASQRIEQGFTHYNEKTNFDALMLKFFPWWMHESQRWPWLTRTFIGKPTALSMWQSYQDTTNQGYVPVSELPLVGGVAKMIPGLDSMQINPTRLITPFNPIQPTNLFRYSNFDDGLAGTMQQLDRVMSTVGVSPFDVWDMGQAAAQNQAGSELPTPLKFGLDLARGSNVPGLTQAAASIQRALPDNYRDYYTRMVLASNGFEPDKVYDDALSGDPTAQSTLDVAQEQSSLIQSVLMQTGSIARFRTPEYNDYQQARAAAVESMTGISQATQLAMKNDGITVSQLRAFSPQQREELANLPGATNFNELTEPLLNPAARQLRQKQREFYQTLDTERDSQLVQQEADDRRLQSNLISGVEWRKRYQDRSGAVSDLLSDLKKSPAYKDVPVSAQEQTQARQRFNLPPFVMSPEDMMLQQYYAVKPESDVVTGDVNWSKFFDDRQAVLDQNPGLKPILDAKLAKNNTAQVVDFKQAAETLRPYFGIKDSILQQYPTLQALVSQAQLIQNQDPVMGQQFRENNDQLKTLSALVRKTQQQARLEFPQIDQALVKYYGAQPAQYQQWAKKYEAPQTQKNIPQYQAAL